MTNRAIELLRLKQEFDIANGLAPGNDIFPVVGYTPVQLKQLGVDNAIPANCMPELAQDELFQLIFPHVATTADELLETPNSTSNCISIALKTATGEARVGQWEDLHTLWSMVGWYLDTAAMAALTTEFDARMRHITTTAYRRDDELTAGNLAYSMEEIRAGVCDDRARHVINALRTEVVAMRAYLAARGLADEVVIIASQTMRSTLCDGSYTVGVDGGDVRVFVNNATHMNNHIYIAPAKGFGQTLIATAVVEDTGALRCYMSYAHQTKLSVLARITLK